VSAVLRVAKIMRASRAHPGVFARYHRGDPGFLDGLWNGIKGAVGGLISGGPAGAIVGGVAGLAGGRKGSSGTSFFGKALTQMRSAGPGVGLAAPVSVGVAGMLPFGFGDPPKKPPLMPGADGRDTDGGIPSVTEWMSGQGVRHKSAYATGGCPSGYHVNKTGYYTRQGYVAPGSQCVRNRKRNPLNPRAASRAMARLEGAKKATRSIQKFFGGTKLRAHSHGGCGCRKKRR
jgi:hypothetical protein